MRKRHQWLRGLALALTVLVLGTVVWGALVPGASGQRVPERAVAGALPDTHDGASRGAAVCYTIDTSRPEWLGRSAYLPLVLRAH